MRGLSLLLPFCERFTTDYDIHTSSLSFTGGLIWRLQLARKKGSWRETRMDLDEAGNAPTSLQRSAATFTTQGENGG
jgi:hypothetical protein